MVEEREARVSSQVKGFAAGTVSGLTKLAIGHPFDTLKVRLQCAPPGLYKGPIDALRKTILNEGGLALYKGASPPAFGWALSDALLMGSLNTYRLYFAKKQAERENRAVPKTTEGLKLRWHFLSGAMAGCTVCVVVTPVELLKAKLQMQTHASQRLYTGPIDCARQIISARGVLGLWHAFPATLAFRSWFGVMFGSYEIMLRKLKQMEVPVGRANFLAGGFSSMLFWAGSFPSDVVKNRLMSDLITKPRYPTYMACARQVWSEGGIRAFYRGFTVCPIIAFMGRLTHPALHYSRIPYKCVSCFRMGKYYAPAAKGVALATVLGSV